MNLPGYIQLVTDVHTVVLYQANSTMSLVLALRFAVNFIRNLKHASTLSRSLLSPGPYIVVSVTSTYAACNLMFHYYSSIDIRERPVKFRYIAIWESNAGILIEACRR